MKKPTFNDVRYQRHFVIPQLAKEACVDEVIVLQMLLNRSVKKADALHVLAALSQMTGETYTLENVEVVLDDT